MQYPKVSVNPKPKYPKVSEPKFRASIGYRGYCSNTYSNGPWPADTQVSPVGYSRPCLLILTKLCKSVANDELSTAAIRNERRKVDLGSGR